MTITKLFIILLVFWIAGALICLSNVRASIEDAVVSAISESEKVLVSAYQAVIEADETGANVSSLLVELNEAGEALAGANTANRVGNLDEASRLADLCLEISEAVRGKAYLLQVEAHGSRVVSYWLTSVGSLIGMVTVALGSSWAWRCFKRRYYRQVVRIRSEVVSDES